MMKRYGLGIVLMVSVLTGCGTHLSVHLITERQMPILPTQGGIAIPLNNTSEVLLNLRGFRMDLTPSTKPQDPTDRQPELKPWLNYRLHF